MRITILGDSLGLPRRKDNGALTWEQTWPYLLGAYLQESSSQNPEILNYSRRLRTADETLDDLDEYVLLRPPDVLIIQVGICDCAPRIFSRRFQRLFLSNHFFPWQIRKLVINLTSPNRGWILKHLPPVVYLPIKQYQKAIEGIAKKLQAEMPGLALYFVSIIPATREYEQSSPGVSQNIAKYNSVLKTICQSFGAALIDIEQVLKVQGHSLDNFLNQDQIHLNPPGSKLLAEFIAQEITRSTKLSPASRSAVD